MGRPLVGLFGALVLGAAVGVIKGGHLPGPPTDVLLVTRVMGLLSGLRSGSAIAIGWREKNARYANIFPKTRTH